jgi:hypothetical protein
MVVVVVVVVVVVGVYWICKYYKRCGKVGMK